MKRVDQNILLNEKYIHKTEYVQQHFKAESSIFTVTSSMGNISVGSLD